MHTMKVTENNQRDPTNKLTNWSVYLRPDSITPVLCKITLPQAMTPPLLCPGYHASVIANITIQVRFYRPYSELTQIPDTRPVPGGHQLVIIYTSVTMVTIQVSQVTKILEHLISNQIYYI